MLTYLNDSSNRMVLDWLGFFQEYDFETRFKRGVLNVLPHELSHMYSMLELDHGLKKPGLGDGGGCSLLTELCGIVRGTGSGVRQATCKFLQEKLDKVWPATAEERKEILSSTHAKSHMGENMLFNMIWENGNVCVYQSRSGKTNSRSKQNSRLASKNFIKKGRNKLARVKHT